MSTLNSLITVLRLYIIPSGVVLRVIYCLVKMISSDDVEIYKRRIVYTIGFGIVAELLLSIKNIIEYYY